MEEREDDTNSGIGKKKLPYLTGLFKDLESVDAYQGVLDHGYDKDEHPVS